MLPSFMQKRWEAILDLVKEYQDKKLITIPKFTISPEWIRSKQWYEDQENDTYELTLKGMTLDECRKVIDLIDDERDQELMAMVMRPLLDEE